MANQEGFVQVAADGAGKKIRNRAVDVLQPDGTTVTVYQQEVTRVADDGTILDSTGWVETATQKNDRFMQEQILDALQQIVALLSIPPPMTVILGE